jgi:hypothetical protein
MPRTRREQRRKDLQASFDAIKNSLFWTEYQKCLQAQHDAALLAVRAGASGAEKDLRVAASLCSAFHTALTMPTLLMSGAFGMDDAQEDTEGSDDE